MKHYTLYGCLVGALALAGCVSSSNPAGHNALPDPEAAPQPLLQKQFVLDVLQHVYRWHFDQS